MRGSIGPTNLAPTSIIGASFNQTVGASLGRTDRWTVCGSFNCTAHSRCEVEGFDRSGNLLVQLEASAAPTAHCWIKLRPHCANFDRTKRWTAPPVRLNISPVDRSPSDIRVLTITLPFQTRTLLLQVVVWGFVVCNGYKTRRVFMEGFGIFLP